MTLKMTPAELDRAADSLLMKAKAINGHLDDLENDLNPLRASWEGAAQQAYDRAQREWNETMREMISILGVTANTVNQSKVAYQTRDRMQALGFGG